MHEFSIVNALLEMCEKNATANDATKITRVEVKIGKLSGVEPYLLETAFDTFKEQTICDGAELVVNLQDLVIKCQKVSLMTRRYFSKSLVKAHLWVALKIV